MEEGEGPDHFTLQGMVHTHCHMLTPHHSSRENTGPKMYFTQKPVNLVSE